jgi:hypothetical protein
MAEGGRAMTAGRGPLNYSTSIPAARTIGECQDILASAGAAAVAVQYENREPVGLSFRIATPRGLRDFSLPVNVDGVEQLLGNAHAAGRLSSSRGRNAASFTTRKHAAAVAWRVVKDWLEAQVALINADMVTLDQVMLPYLQVSDDQTLYQAFASGRGELTEGRP